MSEVFYTGLYSSLIGFVLAMGSQCYRSKCKEVKFCCIKIIRNVEYLKNTAALLFNDKPEYRSHANDVISKYENGTIQRLDSALNLITKISQS